MCEGEREGERGRMKRERERDIGCVFLRVYVIRYMCGLYGWFWMCK